MEQRLGLLQAALAALEADRFADVCRCCEVALQLDDGDVEARFLLGLGLGARGRAEAAAPLLNAVAQARPGHPHPCRDVATILHRIGARAGIAWQFAACLRLAPEDLGLRHAYADHLQDIGQAEAALAMLAPVLAARPEHVPALVLAGLALSDAGDFGGAVEHLRAAVAIDPQHAAAWSDLGVLLAVQGDQAGAMTAHDRALGCRPDDARLRVNRVVTLLRAGRMTEAWRDYEWRLHLPGRADFPLELLMPDFASQPDICGRTILVTHEEGFGDTLQFARYLPMLVALGATVLVAAPAPLRRLLGGINGVHLVAEEDVAAGRWRQVDHVCPFPSLPRVFGTVLDSIPAAPYLKADETAVAAWSRRLPQDGLRVGLVWAGQARPWLPGFDALDRRRSTTLATFAPWQAIEGVRWISLQKGPAGEAAATWEGICDPMAEVVDFADTAAIIANLDLVVGVDTAVVHLAGALGRPVFLLDRVDHCWRWLSGRTDSPWYPGLRIFRQETAGDWSGVVQKVAASITSLRVAREMVVSTGA